MEDRNYLPRLDRVHYQGTALVFWTHTLDARAKGWLNAVFHKEFRELMVHAAARYQLSCPAYCLMPDHFHLLWLGRTPSSDQLNATAFARRQLNRMLAGQSLVDRSNRTGKPADSAMAVGFPKYRLQHQAHDHVMRVEERQRDAFIKTCAYTLNNPVRAGLVSHPWEWEFSGSVVPGYPTLWPFAIDFWELFWKIHWKEIPE